MQKYLQLARYMNMPVADLSLSDIDKIAAVFGVDLTSNEDLRDAALSLLRGDDINVVSDLIQKPESIKKLLALLQAIPKAGDNLLPIQQCPHCFNFFSMET